MTSRVSLSKRKEFLLEISRHGLLQGYPACFFSLSAEISVTGLDKGCLTHHLLSDQLADYALKKPCCFKAGHLIHSRQKPCR